MNIRTNNGLYITICTFLMVVAVVYPAYAQILIAKPISSTVYVNGKNIEFNAYKIGNSNYFKLRELAVAVNGTEKEFNVNWDTEKNAIFLQSGEGYTQDEQKKIPISKKDRGAVKSSATVYVNELLSPFEGYLIDGNNYYKLRDVLGIFDIGVSYDDKSNAIQITTSEHSEKASLPVPKSDLMSAKEIYEKCSPSVFYLETADVNGNVLYRGSGFFIDEKGLAVTNYHVLEEAFSAKIVLSDNKTYPVKNIVAYDVEKDLAILSIEEQKVVPLKFGNEEEIKGGEKIYTIGSPMGLSNTISEGVISNPNRILGDISYMQISAPISQGSSGGALLNMKGEVIGITTAGIDGGQNLNFALSIARVKELLKERRLISIKDMTEEVARYQYENLEEAFTTVIPEEEPNDLSEEAQYIKNGASITGILDDDYLDMFYALCATAGTVKVYAYSSSPYFENISILLTDDKEIDASMGEFYVLEDDTFAIYAEFEVKTPGYQNIVMVPPEGMGDIFPDIEYLFYYEFIPN